MHWLLNKADQLKNMERREPRSAWLKSAQQKLVLMSQFNFFRDEKRRNRRISFVLESWLGLNTDESPEGLKLRDSL